MDSRLLNDRYRLLEPIGQGGMSVVWRGHDELLDRDVAVKILSAGGDERFRATIRSEAKAAGQLSHARIAHIYDFGETTINGEHLPYLVMELVHGQALSERFADIGALPWREAVTVAAEISDALAAAHLHGLVHNDIKPDNVILTTGGVKLIDFGISALVGSPEYKDGQLLGTASYVAPERLAGANVDAAADVYAVGVLLYRLLTGTAPWPVDRRTEVLRAHLNTPPMPLPPIEGAPAQLADICAACMDKRPEHRPTAAALAIQLTRLATRPAANVATGVLPVAMLPDGGLADGGPSGGRLADGGLATAGLPAAGATGTRQLADAPAAPARSRRGRRPLLIAGAAAATGLAVLAATAWSHGGAGGSSPASAATRPCAAMFAVTHDSGHGFAADLTVTNTGTTDVHGIRVAFAFPGNQRLTKSSGSTVTVTPADHARHTATIGQSGTAVTATANLTLRPRGSVTVPISGTYQHANPIPTAFTLGGHACQAEVAGASTGGTTTTPKKSGAPRPPAATGTTAPATTSATTPAPAGTTPATTGSTPTATPTATEAPSQAPPTTDPTTDAAVDPATSPTG